LRPWGLSAQPLVTILSRFSTTLRLSLYGGRPMSTTTATQSKQLTKKELKKFQELLEEKRKAVLDRARQMLSVENMALDTNDLPDEMDLASSEYLQSFEFRLRGREKSLLSKLDLALKKITDGTFGICEICEEPIGKKRLEARPETTLCIKCKEDQEREERTMG
jgi:DnaK suppressor protein